MKVIIISICLFISMRSAAQTTSLTWAENSIRGKVKSITSTANWMKKQFGEWEISSFYWSETAAFNAQGFLTSSSRQENMDYSDEYILRYDREGHMVEKQNSYGKKKGKKERTYKSVYDAKGREIQLDLIDSDGELYWRKKMKYAESGPLVETASYDGSGDLTSREFYEYNTKGQLVDIRKVNSQGAVIKHTVTEYDDAGRKLTEEIDDTGYQTAKTKYSWEYKDGVVNIERRSFQAKGTKVAITEKEFDQWGNVIRFVERTGTVYTTVYTFDENDNWTSALCTFKGFDGLTAYRIDRVVKYY